MLYRSSMPSNKKAFYSETDSFNLTASLDDDTLSLTLKDFNKMLIYFDEFKKQNIDSQIELNDILRGLFRSYQSGSYHKHTVRLTNYQFGKFLPREDFPCYKIEPGGLVTINAMIQDNTTYKFILKQVKLTLKLYRPLILVEIDDIKQDIQGDRVIQNLYIEIQNNSKMLTSLYDNVSLVQQKNQGIKYELKLFQQAYESSLDLIIDLERVREQNRIKQGVNYLKESLKNQKDIQILQKVRRNKQALTQIQKMIQNIEIKQNHMSLPQKNVDCFRVDGKIVQYIGPDGQRTQFIFNFPISSINSGDDQFRIKVTGSQKILIGVVDYLRRKNHRYSYDSNSVLCYNYDGTKYPEKTKQGKGINQGNLVEVVINRSKKTITYLVNGVVSAKQTSDFLADGTKILMPYVEFIQKDDKVEWIN